MADIQEENFKVNRITRLVDMYHDYNNSMKKRSGVIPGKSKLGKVNDETDSKKFICPKCNKNNWKSIETFRMHKSHCKPNNQEVLCKKSKRYQLICSDCGAEFISNQDYRSHIQGQVSGDQNEPQQEHTTFVCPIHCGTAFSTNQCLQHHITQCFAQQRLGPYHVISCRNK